MVESIIKEIDLQQHFNNDPEIETIYFGGGTPSLLTDEELSSILKNIYARFNVTVDAEITLEVNPDDVNPLQLSQWLSQGINRLSVGIQTFQQDELQWMNRAHSAEDSIRCLQQINEAGFTNFSADLIYGSPFLTNELLEKNVQLMSQFNVPHLSCYALTVENKTALHHQVSKKTIQINDVHQSEQILWLMNTLPLYGYEQYEISNFAKQGFRSKHNSSYWKGKPYYGFGPSAHSFNGENIRRWNIANNNLYIKAIEENLPFAEEEILTPVQQINETIMIALRTSDGLDLKQLREKSGENILDLVLQSAEKYILTKKLILINDKLILTNEGKVFADGIAADLFIEEN